MGRPRNPVSGRRRDQKQLLLLRRKTLRPGPGTDGGRLHLEPVGQSLFADQPDGSCTGRFGLVEKVGAHGKSLVDCGAYALMHKAFRRDLLH